MTLGYFLCSILFAFLRINSRAQYTSCTGNTSTIANGFCDTENNNIDCDYDGGDCCECTCLRDGHYPCGFGGFDCLNPSAISECQTKASGAPACSSEYAVLHWVVNDSASASGFAEAVNCTGGTFNVNWEGRVVINRTISVAEGTTVHLTGANSESEVDGGGRVRILTLLNATLNTYDIGFSNGNATYGGAIAATALRMTLNHTQFNDNEASSVAGGLYLDGNSLLTMNGLSIFARNSAGSQGGALAGTSGSDISWSGPTTFLNNTAVLGGGAVYTHDCSVSWSAKTLFANNSVYPWTEGSGGGALVVAEGSTAFWSAETSFVNNIGNYGGALFINDGSNVSWSAETLFVNNSGYLGGAIFVWTDSVLSWTSETSFIKNHAVAGSGGGLFVYDGCSIWWSSGVAETHFINNIADFDGGALYVGDNSILVWSADTHFINNVADDDGGALYVGDNSILSWSADTYFINNVADDDGGALYVGDNSILVWSADTHFINNVAVDDGGALYVGDNSNLSWSADTHFINNVADDDGGALYVGDNSILVWSGEAYFFDNAALDNGGALYVNENSHVLWSAETSFINNSGDFGGAFYVRDACSVRWSGVTSFIDNIGEDGGAIRLYLDSEVSWSAETFFINNSATAGAGGALHLREGCSVWWSGVTSFINNSVASYGGAMYLDDGSKASWSDGTYFIRNSAAGNSGGALYAVDGSIISWSADTLFSYNIANTNGGAINIGRSSNVSWEAPTNFSNNRASFSGGAITLYENSEISWGDATIFESNSAKSSGGALYSLSGSGVTMLGHTIFLDNDAGQDGGAVYIYHSSDQEQSFLTIRNATVFRGNECGSNGGGMVLIGSVSTKLDTANISFSGNIATIAGGAVYVSGVTAGPKFVGTKFVLNSAKIGGGVYTTGSGIAVEFNGDGVPEPQFPLTFTSCEFNGNYASTRGGALDSGAGIDLIVNTSFVDNVAGSGGALRLSGEASLEGCDFIENTSDEDKGLGVYNEGFVSSISNCRFINNVVSCEPSSFLAYNKSDVEFDTVCKGCDTQCENCDLEGKGPICVEEYGHSSSLGKNTTVEMLLIERGYWRASNTSPNILACYNSDACRGGVTGAQDYCLGGYEGPYCSVCSDGYTPSIGFSCNKCPDTSGPGVGLITALGAVGVVGFFAFLTYMLSGEERSADRGIVARISRFIPLHSLKIIIVVWQIITQFCNVANFAFPGIYQKFLDGVDLLNFDFSWVISTGCIADIDFHDRLLISTLGPIIGIAILGTTFAVGVYRYRESEAAYRIVRSKHLSMILLLTFLIYSSVSTTVFAMFVCDDLDDGTSYLRADYRIDCYSFDHRALQIYAGFMVVLYAIGIPAFYAFLLFSNRNTLNKSGDREIDGSLTSFADLWKPYRPTCFFYEVVECCRRVLLTGIVVFIYPDSAAQIAVALVMATTFFIFFEALAPYVSAWDSLVSRMGHAIVVTSMFLALLLKVDVSQERAISQKAFEAVLIFVHVIMVLVVMVESGAMVVAWRRERVSEDPEPRCSRSLGHITIANGIGSPDPDMDGLSFGEEELRESTSTSVTLCRKQESRSIHSFLGDN